VLKRAAALMWAADPFLCHAHPPERAAANYCPPIRFASRLAHGVTKRNVRVGRQYSERELPLDDTIPSEPPTTTTTPILPSESFSRLTANQNRYLPARRSAHLPARARARVVDPSLYPGVNNNPELASRLHNKTVHSGVRHIMRCANRGEIANLMTRGQTTSAYERANYNFTHYLPGSAGRSSRDGGKTTIEFREAAGTMDPLWVGTWASVCLAIFRFARDATEGEFWAVIGRLADAEAKEESTGVVGKGRYDLVSLLFDWGLFAEGLFLERKLLVEDPERGFWFRCRVIKKANGWEDGGHSNGVTPVVNDYVDMETWEAEWRSPPAASSPAASPPAASSEWTITSNGQPISKSGLSTPFLKSPPGPPTGGINW
jgi:hypothetical protein